MGYLLLETSALALRDPKPGDGSFQSGETDAQTDPVDPADPSRQRAHAWAGES